MTTGVAILASWDLFILGLLPFAVKNIAVQASQRQVTILRQEYHMLCEENDYNLPDYSKLTADIQQPFCADLTAQIVKATFDADDVKFVCMQATAGLSAMSGFVGLWAVYASNARAAKMYMWTLPPKYLLSLGFVSGMDLQKLNQHRLSCSLLGVWFLYAFKAVWSYHGRLRRRHHLGGYPEDAEVAASGDDDT
ncbi:unnamed protein product [Ectocarpus sp. 6 AP-2014]